MDQTTVRSSEGDAGLAKAANKLADALNAAEERRSFFTAKTLAVYLGLSERTVRDLIASKDDRPPVIPSYKVAGARRIRPEDVDAYLETVRDAA
jgi:excisionase family DNA binding protein